MNSEEIIEEIPIKHNNDDKSTITDCEDDSALNKQIEKCCKRKTNFDGSINESVNKLRYQMLNFGIIRKEDFISVKAWTNFVKFMKHSKSTIVNLVRKNERMKNKVETLNDMIITLKKYDLITDRAAKILEKSYCDRFKIPPLEIRM